MEKLRIVLADDHPLFVLGVKGMITQRRIGTVIQVASDSDALINVLGTIPCDLLVTEYVMPGLRHGDGMRLLGYLRRTFPELRVIVLTMVNNIGVRGSIWRIGVAGLMSKADLTEALPIAIQAVAGGRRYLSPMMRASVIADNTIEDGSAVHLSPREAEVLRLFASGLSAAEVADRLQRSRKTISRHKRSGMARLGITTDCALFQYMSEYDASQIGRRRDLT
ncbi:response regulator [Paraburkholderia fungorum]|uniref:response regulator n=1 Tax=Paraburkholderia fungorum TaxID=134537 RepID=UPI0038B8217C